MNKQQYPKDLVENMTIWTCLRPHLDREFLSLLHLLGLLRGGSGHAGGLVNLLIIGQHDLVELLSLERRGLLQKLADDRQWLVGHHGLHNVRPDEGLPLSLAQGGQPFLLTKMVTVAEGQVLKGMLDGRLHSGQLGFLVGREANVLAFQIHGNHHVAATANDHV